MTQLPPKQTPLTAANEINTHDLANNLVDMYWFAYIVDAGSFSVAADNHGVSKSSLSRRVSQLETRLGVQLLHRNPRFLSLTSIGIEVYRHTLEMLNAAQKAAESVQKALDNPSGTVNIVLPSILNSWLMPVLHNFQQLYPHIQLTLHTSDRTQEMSSQAIDLALSLFAAPSDSTQIVTRKLAKLTFVNVLSSTSNAEQATAIKLNYLASNEKSCLLVNNYLSALEAVTAGFGYANIPLCACDKAIRAGDIKFFDKQESLQTLYAFTQPHRGITLATRVLLEYLSVHIIQNETVGIKSFSNLLEVKNIDSALYQKETQ